MTGDIVHRFISAIEQGRLGDALELVSEGCVYDNVPLAAVEGRPAIRAVLEPFLARCTEVRWDVLHQVIEGSETDATVMNERVDRFMINGTWIALPVAGLFVVSDGLITLWRDYFDRSTFESQLAAAG